MWPFNRLFATKKADSKTSPDEIRGVPSHLRTTDVQRIDHEGNLLEETAAATVLEEAPSPIAGASANNADSGIVVVSDGTPGEGVGVSITRVGDPLHGFGLTDIVLSELTDADGWHTCVLPISGKRIGVRRLQVEGGEDVWEAQYDNKPLGKFPTKFTAQQVALSAASIDPEVSAAASGVAEMAASQAFDKTGG
jgi:hypothetical protein